MIQDLSDLVVKATKVEHLSDLKSILDEYQERLSDFMQIPQVKELYFPEYLGTVKSLGAWGGDFVLVTYREGMHDYFKEKGYEIIIPFSEMIK